MRKITNEDLLDRNLFQELLLEDDANVKIDPNGLPKEATEVPPELSRWYENVDDDELDEAESLMKSVLENPLTEEDTSDIEKVLNEALLHTLVSKRYGDNEWENVLLVGPAGMGKTAIVYSWAKKNKINLVHVVASTKSAEDFGGAITPDKTGEVVKRLASTEWDKLGTVKNSVLFLDEFNRAKDEIRGALLTLIQDHKVEDPRDPTGNMRSLPNFLFTIAAINPYTVEGTYNVHAMDIAEITRFRRVFLKNQKKVTEHYLLKKFAETYNKYKLDSFEEVPEDPDDPEYKVYQYLQQKFGIEIKRKVLLTKTLMENELFEFDTDEEIASNSEEIGGTGQSTTARSLTMLLNSCDGTKRDFLNKWDQFCNPLKKKMAETCLADFKDIQNKANSVFKSHKSKEEKEADAILKSFGF